MSAEMLKSSNRKSPWNVLMITVDQLGRNHTPLGGDPVNDMPTLRYLAGHGVDYDNCYSSCPVCIPARRSLMTGMTPRSHGDRIYNDTMPMPEGVTTLAKAFRDAGYQAYSVGKLHVYPQRNRIGFDDCLIMEEGRYEFGETDDYQIWLGEHGYLGQEFLHGMGNNVYYTRPWHLPEEAHPTNWATRKMCEMIKRRDPTRPSFFYLSYQFPHPPLVPLQTYMDMYRDLTLPECREDDWMPSGNAADQRTANVLTDLGAAALQYNWRERELARKAYYAQCTHIDHQIRIVLGTLRECNMSDNTLILFCADHGDMLFDHDMVAKRVFYESSANIPMILCGKPLEERLLQEAIGRTDHRICSLEDVMPTILDLCGIAVPPTVEGLSMVGGPQREWLYGECGEGGKATRMIRDASYKMIYYPNGNLTQLFDMRTDRDEKHDLMKDKNCPQDVVNNMRQRLISCLYGGDLNYLQNGEIVGTQYHAVEKKMDYGLYNQRGYHWPTPAQYDSIGKNA